MLFHACSMTERAPGRTTDHLQAYCSTFSHDFFARNGTCTHSGEGHAVIDSVRPLTTQQRRCPHLFLIYFKREQKLTIVYKISHPSHMLSYVHYLHASVHLDRTSSLSQAKCHNEL